MQCNYDSVRMHHVSGLFFNSKGSFFFFLQVTDHDKELFKVTLDVIKEDCRKPRRK